MLPLYSLIILLFPTIIALNMLLYHMIVRKALRKYIKPKLKDNNMSFIKYKWPGLFSNGDFKDDEMALTIMSKNGSIVNSTYVDIYYNKLDDTKKITARIDTIFFFIYKVHYSSKL
jgi:hypothetical protein